MSLKVAVGVIFPCQSQMYSAVQHFPGGAVSVPVVT